MVDSMAFSLDLCLFRPINIRTLDAVCLLHLRELMLLTLKKFLCRLRIFVLICVISCFQKLNSSFQLDSVMIALCNWLYMGYNVSIYIFCIRDANLKSFSQFCSSIAGLLYCPCTNYWKNYNHQTLNSCGLELLPKYHYSQCHLYKNALSTGH